MNQIPFIDPIAFQLGPISIHWYGISYLAGIILGWTYLKLYVSRFSKSWSSVEIDDLVFYAAIGAVIGGRIGYTFFYDWGSFVENPIKIFALWEGGMSFHGGIIGVAVALFFFAKKTEKNLLSVGDFFVPAVPIGLGLGRCANFINQELWGLPSNVSWAVTFTNPAAGFIARHPSQLYQAVGEGLIIFVLLFFFVRVELREGKVTALFLIFYSLFRFLAEFFREPDAHLGYILGGWLTMGQILTVPLMFIGVAIFFKDTVDMKTIKRKYL